MQRQGIWAIIVLVIVGLTALIVSLWLTGEAIPAGSGQSVVAPSSVATQVVKGPSRAPATSTPAIPVAGPASSPLPVSRGPAETASPPATRNPSPIPQPTGTPTLSAASALVRKVAQAEANLRSGQIRATMDYGNGVRTSVSLLFDLGGDGNTPVLHSTTTYTQSKATRTVELVIVGNQSWQREANAAWVEVPEQEGIWGRIQSFLPHADFASGPTFESSGKLAILNWLDTGRDTDVTLQAEPTTGTPKQLRAVIHATNLELTVNYMGWNTPVKVAPPARK